MDWPSFLQKQFPQMVRSGAALIAKKMAEQPAPEDLAEKFDTRRLAAFEVFEKKSLERPPLVEIPDDLGEAEVRPHFPAPSHENCPYCALEESAGTVRNHLAFVAKECQADKLGPATGGMVPKSRAQNQETQRLAQNIVNDGGPVAILGGAIVKLGEALDQKLQWINTCEEAEQAAIIAQRIWELSAKAAQMEFSGASPGR